MNLTAEGLERMPVVSSMGENAFKKCSAGPTVREKKWQPHVSSIKKRKRRGGGNEIDIYNGWRSDHPPDVGQ